MCVYDDDFCGCFSVRWLVLIIFLYYKTTKTVNVSLMGSDVYSD